MQMNKAGAFPRPFGRARLPLCCRLAVRLCRLFVRGRRCRMCVLRVLVRFFVIAGFVVFRRCRVVSCCFRVVFRRFSVRFVCHVDFPSGV
jgi:hypothetical protein